ncbi:na(+)/H(+) antiporter [Trichomonascus vanleenenianus]|uniref:Nha1p n=1 Tax=Trichomonascus vanleenenianus TaxID=2268995 RepID=UPI003EC9CFF5
MAWDQLWIDKPHVAYALIGGFITLFSLISLFVKEKLYIGEATVATIFGVIIGPHCLNWFVPTSWGNTDYITLEISRIVLIVQIFAVAVELPKKYMLKHWLSVVILLLPVMTFGWLISSVFIWKLIPGLSWVEGLTIAACVTATDPVLASAVVGKGKFAKRVPGHLRNLLSAESGCNDGMAFPFAYLALYSIMYAGSHSQIAFHFIVITVLYECVFGCVLGAAIGFTGRKLIQFCEKHNLIDRESFLSFYFVIALFCTGVGSIIGVDDLLVSFAAGTAFSWNGSYAKKTEESHVSNVIDLLINMSFFVYFGAIVPWDQFNNGAIGLNAWRLVVIAILVLLFRRIPIIFMVKPITPDIRTWREALFCGHFGPIGVGAIFISILSRAELESGEPTPLASLPPPGAPNYNAIATIWPITTFLVVASIIVHGSSIAVFALGKRLNNMTITMTYTTNGNNQSWLQRLPRIESGRTLSLHKVDTEEPSRFKIGITAKPAGGMKRKKKGTPARERPEAAAIDLSGGRTPTHPTEADYEENINDEQGNVYQEGRHVIVEDAQGEVITTVERPDESSTSSSGRDQPHETIAQKRQRSFSSGSGKEKAPEEKPVTTDTSETRREGARKHPAKRVTAYQLDNDVIIENEEGEIIRRYRINRRPTEQSTGGTGSQAPLGLRTLVQGLDKTLSFIGLKRTDSQLGSPGGPNAPAQSTPSASTSTDVEKHPQRQGGRSRDELVLVDSADQDLDVDDETVRQHLKTMLNEQNLATGATHSEKAHQPHPAVTGTPERQSSSSPVTRVPRNFLGQAEDEEEEEESLYNATVEDEEEETEVERRRRLAALGLIHNEEDDDDEEAPPVRVSSPMHTVPPIQEEDEESSSNNQNSGGIRWSRDVKK